MSDLEACCANVESDLSHIISRVNLIADMVEHDVSRVTGIADSIYGCQPMAGSGKSSQDKPFGRMQEIGDAFSRLEAAEAVLREQIERLGRL